MDSQGVWSGECYPQGKSSQDYPSQGKRYNNISSWCNEGCHVSNPRKWPCQEIANNWDLLFLSLIKTKGLTK